MEGYKQTYTQPYFIRDTRPYRVDNDRGIGELPCFAWEISIFVVSYTVLYDKALIILTGI